MLSAQPLNQIYTPASAMPMNRYQSELNKLSETYAAAMEEDVSRLKRAIAGASQSSIIGVGSGGSFTIASLMCNLHERYTGRLSRPSTPLEIVCNPTLAASSPVFLVSAEGKNPDISEALQRARQHSARSIHVLTNRKDSPLTRAVAEFHDVSTHVFEIEKKDGYLATNSLLMDAVLIARAYGELDNPYANFPQALSELRIGKVPLHGWFANIMPFEQEVAKRGALIVAFSPQLNSVAIDLEARLAESALAHCQLTDIRSFAHGRHLWLATRRDDVAVLAVTETSLSGLWREMYRLFPAGIASAEMQLESFAPTDLIAGLVAEMYFVNELAKCFGRDPGRPDVPQFGRALYYLDVTRAIPPPF